MRKTLVASLTRRVQGFCKVVEVYELTDKYGPPEYRIIYRGSAFYWQKTSRKHGSWTTKEGALKTIRARTDPV